MTRRTAKDISAVRASTSKTKLMKRNCDEKKVVKNICIRSNNVKRWNRLKKKLDVQSDSEFLEYLLTLAESQTDRDKCEDSPTEQDADKEWWIASTSQTARGPLRRSARNTQPSALKSPNHDPGLEEETEIPLKNNGKRTPQKKPTPEPAPALEATQGELTASEKERLGPQINGQPRTKKRASPIKDTDETINVLYKTEEKEGKEEKKEKESEGTTLPVFMEVGESVKLKRRKKSQSNSVESDSTQRLNDFAEASNRKRRKFRSVLKEKSDTASEKEEPEVENTREQAKAQAQVAGIGAGEVDSTLGEKPAWTGCDNLTDGGVIADHQISSSSEAVAPVAGLPVHGEHDAETERKDEASDENSSPDQENFKVAVKVKLCLDCDSRHVKELCPVHHPQQTVRDTLSHEQWIARSMRNRSTVIERPRIGRGSKAGLPNDAEKSGDGEHEVSSAGLVEVQNCQPKTYAEESLPSGLELRVVLTRHGDSVFATEPIPKFTCFGPLVGQRVREMDISDEAEMKYVWEVKTDGQSHYVSTEDPQRSNWMRFLRPAPSREDRNVSLVTKNGELYFVTTADLSANEELLYWTDDTVSAWSKKRMSKSSCGGCNLHFAHPLYYRTHCLLFHDPNHSLTIRKYHCKVCGETVLGKENIMRHATQQHQGRGAYQCQYCDKFFLRLNYLEMHRTYGCAANPQRSRPLCDFCGRKFCQPQKLKVHIKRMHSDMSEVLRDFQCKSCLRILGSRAALQRHLKEVHHRDMTGSCSCDRCGKTFQNRSNLKIHMLTHSGIKPFRCSEKGCNAAFTTKQCLQFHYKKVHGFSEEAIPPIERSVAFTFDAYSGETSNSKSSDDRADAPVVKPAPRQPPLSKPEQEQEQEQEQAPDADENMQPLGPHPWEMRLQERQLEPDSSMPLPSGNGKVPPAEESRGDAAFVSVESDGSAPASPSPPAGLRSVLSKGSKKWLGEALEVAEEAAAALRLSPRTKREVYGFEEAANKGTYAAGDCAQRTDQPAFHDIHVDLASALGRNHIVSSALPTFHRPESASLLVEAALDAAERDIVMCVPPAKSPSDNMFYSREQSSPPDVYYSHAPAATPVPSASHFSADHQYVELAEQPPSPQRVYELQPSHHLHGHHDRVGPQSSDDESPPMEPDCVPCTAQNLSMGLKDKPVSPMEMSAYKSYEPPPGTVAYEAHDSFSDDTSPRYHSLYEIPQDRQTVDLSLASRNGGSGGYSPYGEAVRSVDLSIPRHAVGPPPGHGLLPLPVPAQATSPPPYGNHGYGYVPGQRSAAAPNYHPYAGYY